MAMRHGLGDLFGAGLRGVSRYTGTLFAVFVVQSLVAATCMAAVAVVLAQAFARLPLFDQAVDGDLVALIWCLRYARPSFLAIGGIVFATLVLWQLASWFIAGGLYGVFAQRPESRGDTVRCFGASGAATYLAYARLAVCSLPGWTLVLTVLAMSLELVGPRIASALTVSQLLGSLAIAVVPAGLLLHFFWTVADYARIELALRHETHAPSVLMTYVRTIGYVLRRPLTFVHGGFGWLVFAIVTGAYIALAQGHPMYGAGGAITLFAVRQGVSLLRFAARLAIMAGQVELGRTRPLPPRKVEPQAAPAEA